MNVLSRALVAELAQHARQSGVESSVAGGGSSPAPESGAFCAGANLKERQGWTEDDVRHWLLELHTPSVRSSAAPSPGSPRINGVALGGRVRAGAGLRHCG